MVHVGLDGLARHYTHYVVDYGLDVSPDFQRNYVWTPEQKIRFMEYFLRGGTSGLDIYCNSPTWQNAHRPDEWFVLVDGKQRLDAALGFLNNEFPIFGTYFREFTDRLRMTQGNFRWHVNTLQTREEVLQWYLDLNSGGTVHTEDELEKVRELLKAGENYQRPSAEQIKEHGNLSRAILQVAIEEERKQVEERQRSAEAHAAEAAAKPKRRGGKRGV
jgi:hypothetical protein